MKSLIMKCTNCGRYTLHHDKCPHCSGPLKSPHPLRYSPHDRYVTYRLRAKMQRGQPSS